MCTHYLKSCESSYFREAVRSLLTRYLTHSKLVQCRTGTKWTSHNKSKETRQTWQNNAKQTTQRQNTAFTIAIHSIRFDGLHPKVRRRLHREKHQANGKGSGETSRPKCCEEKEAFRCCMICMLILQTRCYLYIFIQSQGLSNPNTNHIRCLVLDAVTECSGSWSPAFP